MIIIAGILASPADAAAIAMIAADTKVEKLAQPVNLASEGPLIELVTPTNGGTYISPIGIEIGFMSKDGASIDLSTLKVTVVSTTIAGVFELDITEDIIDYTSEDGIMAPSAEIPPGEHVVTIEIADSEERVAQRQLAITVREESVLERRKKE